MHFTEYSSLKHEWAALVQSAVNIALENSPDNFRGYGAGPVWMTVVRYSVSLMDRDNAWASMKPVIDGIVRAGVIADDNELVLPWPFIAQVKVPSNSQCGLVIIMRLLKDEEKNEIVALKTWARSIEKPIAGMMSGSVEVTNE